jgi:uncharacterized membrane protein YdjX (TVP38/TMEM64 family)
LKKRYVLLFLLAGLLVSAWALFSVGHIDAHKALAMIQAETTLAPLVFLLVLVASMMLLMPLGLGLNLGAGIIWGAVLGGVLTTLGSLIAAIAGYLLANKLGEPYLHKYLGSERAQAFIDIIKRNDWEVIFLVRLNPIVPFGLQNYLFGLVGIPFVRYAVLSLLSCAIPSFLYAAIGASLNELVLAGELKSLLTIAGLGLMLITIAYLATLYLRRTGMGNR